MDLSNWFTGSTKIPIVVALKTEKVGNNVWKMPMLDDAAKVAELLAPYGAELDSNWIFSGNLVFGEMERDQFEKLFEVRVDYGFRASLIFGFLLVWMRKIWYTLRDDPKVPAFLEGAVEAVNVVRPRPSTFGLFLDIDLLTPDGARFYPKRKEAGA